MNSQTPQSRAPAPKPTHRSTVVDPDLLQPIAPPPTAQAHAGRPDEADTLVNELADSVRHAGAAPPPRRRRKRRKKNDTLIFGLGLLFLCLVAVGLLIVLTSDDPSTDDADPDALAKQANTPAVQRDRLAVSRISAPALAVYERLEQSKIPPAFETRYRALRRLAAQAQSDQQAQRYNQAYDTYKKLGELAAPLENEIAAWQTDQRAKAETSELRDRVARLRQQAQEADAAQWAAKNWQDGQAASDKAEQLYTAGQYKQASEQFAQAESTYLSAENKALAGQAADSARSELSSALSAGPSEATLRQHANEQVEAMLRLRVEANQQLSEHRYAQAEQSYNNAADALREARQITNLSRYKKFHAFDAGFRASTLMLTAARGDGVEASAQQALAKAFEALRIAPNPAAGITPGDDTGFTVAIQPLVNDARDAIAKQHGEDAQACYLIGFHASIIDQTLQTSALTDAQQKRIHQSLGIIEKEAERAGWNTDKLRPAIEQIRTANRKNRAKTEPSSTRETWEKLLTPLRSRDSASGLMDATSAHLDPKDPELFPE